MNEILDRFSPDAIARNLAMKLKKIRLSKELTQETLAKRSGVSYGSLKRFETKHEISLKNLLRLAVTLGVMDEFHQLFPNDNYNSIDDIINQKKTKNRKRGKNG